MTIASAFIILPSEIADSYHRMILKAIYGEKIKWERL